MADRMYLTFVPVGNGLKRKTKKWTVIGANGGHVGEVRWLTQWRKYVFAPVAQPVVFDPLCLREIANFCQIETEFHYDKLWEKKEGV